MSDLYKFGYTLDETIRTMRDVIDTGNHDRMFLDTYYWLKMLSEYREIGTVEECREAVEKQKPKRLIPVESGMFYDLGFRYKCPNCGIGIKVNNIYHYDVCKICGQKVSNKERGEE